MTAGWEHFAEWKKINDEGEEGIVSLDTMVRAHANPTTSSISSKLHNL